VVKRPPVKVRVIGVSVKAPPVKRAPHTLHPKSPVHPFGITG
jgi:hypothetical protein